MGTYSISPYNNKLNDICHLESFLRRLLNDMIKSIKSNSYSIFLSIKTSRLALIKILINDHNENLYDFNLQAIWPIYDAPMHVSTHK